MYLTVEERVDSLEETLEQFMTQTNRLLIRMERDTRVLKHEMSEFKDEMSEFKKEVRQDQKMRNKQWGELANKMGTIVEDLIAPAVRPVVRKYFHCEIDDFAIHVKRKRKSLQLEGEYDIIAVSDTNQVFLVEVKSSPSEEYLGKFIRNIEKFTQLFPEHADKTLVPIFAGPRFEDSVISLATQRQIYAMAYREWDYVDILNFEKIHRT